MLVGQNQETANAYLRRKEGCMDYQEALIKAVAANNTRIVVELLKRGANPNGYIDTACLRPLHFAAQRNNLEIVQLLLAAGADPFAEDIDGETPLNLAELFGHLAISKLLKKCRVVC